MKESPRNHRSRWTESEDAELRRLAAMYMSVQAISKQMERTPAAILARATHIGATIHNQVSLRSPRRHPEL